MSIFNFGEINFNKNTGSRSPLGPLYKNGFETTTLRYPLDIGGNLDKRHYMIFYIRKQKNSSVQGLRTTNMDIESSGSSLGSIMDGISSVPKMGADLQGAVNSSLGKINSMTGDMFKGVTDSISSTVSSAIGGLNDLFSGTVNVLSGYASTQSLIQNSIKQVSGGSFKLMRTILTTDAIALYMPDTLLYQSTQSYNDPAIGGELLGQGMAALRSSLDEYNKENASGGDSNNNASWALKKSLLLNGTQMAGDAIGDATGSKGAAGLITSAFIGAVKNPMLEMIYNSPDFRKFQFEFMFYPRDEKEALEVQRIIERFRFHQAPELEEGAQGFLVPPSEFDIRMCCNGELNPNLPTIATCVLTDITVNYAPGGFSAYESFQQDKPTLGGTGMPVAIQLNLNFTETSYLTKADFNADINVGQTTLG